MSAETISDAKLYMGEFDLSGAMNETALRYGAELKRATTFGDSGERRLAGLPDAAVEAKGYWDSTLGKGIFNDIGVADVPFSVVPQGETEGNRAFLFRVAAGEYSLGGPVGEMFPFSLGAESSAGDPLIRGTLMHRATRTATANGSGRQLGAVSAAQKLYGALHVFAASGTTPTLDVTVQSDDASGFLSAVTRMTFAQKTAIGSEWPAPIAGAITDDWWRIVWTIGGTSPSFDFAVVLGIQ